MRAQRHAATIGLPFFPGHGHLCNLAATSPTCTALPDMQHNQCPDTACVWVFMDPKSFLECVCRIAQPSCH